MSFVARLYSHAMWEYLYLYRVFLVCSRMLEVVFIAVRFLTIRAPILIICTRLPGLRGRRTPWPDLAPVVGPTKDRPSLLISAEGAMTLGDCQTKEELTKFIELSRKQAGIPRPTAKTIVGGVLRGLFTDLGPTFIKLAQILSMRPEVPPFVREELQLIQDALPAMKPKLMRAIVDCEMAKLGRYTEDVFEWIEDKPIGAASLAQVHRAKLRTGEEVALKIQRPRLEGTVVIDTVIIVDIIINGVVRRLLRSLRQMDLSIFIVSFRQSLRREIDFVLEGRTQEHFRVTYANSPLYSRAMKVARVYPEYTSHRLLTMELVKGITRVDRLPELDPDRVWEMMNVKLTPLYPEHYAVHLFRVVSAHMGDGSIGWGYMHGDPHLGNIYFMEPQDGHDWRVFLCDWGMVEIFPPHVQYWMLDYYRSMMWQSDPQEVLRVILTYVSPIEVWSRFGMRVFQSKVEYSERLRVEKKREYNIFNELGIKLYGRLSRRRNITEFMDITETGTPVTMKTRMKGGGAYSREVLDMIFKNMGPLMGLLVPPGMTMNRFLSHYHWLMYKSNLFVEEISSTMWGAASWNDIYIHALKERLKADIIETIEKKNIIDMKDYLTEVSELLYRPEVTEYLNKASQSEVSK